MANSNLVVQRRRDSIRRHRMRRQASRPMSLQASLRTEALDTNVQYHHLPGSHLYRVLCIDQLGEDF